VRGANRALPEELDVEWLNQIRPDCLYEGSFARSLPECTVELANGRTAADAGASTSKQVYYPCVS
jgi:hypothetical protein